MEPITWKDEYSVGVRQMDEQHKVLVDMINDLICEQREVTHPEKIGLLLTRMTHYAQEHFRDEEYLMAEYDYDRKPAHEEQHRAFVARTMSFCNASDVGPNVLSVALLEFLQSWLIRHILHEDMRYKEFFNGKGLQ